MTAPEVGPLVHRRSVEFEAFDSGDGLTVVGRLQDVRPWADGEHMPVVLHRMELRVVVSLADMAITESVATMGNYPQHECPAIAPAFAGLVGLSVGRGYTRQVQRRFGGAAGCSHLEHLARALGPVVVQAVASCRARTVAQGAAEEYLSAGSGGWLRDTCHVWADGGVGPRKLALGWRPGEGPVPAPPLAQIEAERGIPPGS